MTLPSLHLLFLQPHFEFRFVFEVFRPFKHYVRAAIPLSFILIVCTGILYGPLLLITPAVWVGDLFPLVHLFYDIVINLIFNNHVFFIIINLIWDMLSLLIIVGIFMPMRGKCWVLRKLVLEERSGMPFWGLIAMIDFPYSGVIRRLTVVGYLITEHRFHVIFI